MAKHKGVSTVQKWIQGEVSVISDMYTAQAFAQSFLWNIRTEVETAPLWWSKNRDEWLVGFWKLPGNDLLAGAVSTMISKITATSWYVEGPELQARAYRDILLYHSNFGAGWDQLCQQWVEAFLSRDLGGPLERHRRSIGDHTGPALNFAYLDASKCLPTGKPDWPLGYDDGTQLRKIHRSQVGLMTDMPAGRQEMLDVGYCSVSRAVTTALVMMDIVKYKRERLSDLPPAGILFISNLSNTQWDDIMKQYDARQTNDGNEVWRNLMVVCGVDPAHPTEADLFALSELPEHYDEKTSTEIAVYSFALAFRTDPREFWPVSSGPLGTATEATLQHKKAKAKGEGIIFTHIERILNSPYSLPPTCKFKFDYRDDEEDMMAAEIAYQRLQNIRLMWESSPNRGMPSSGFQSQQRERADGTEGAEGAATIRLQQRRQRWHARQQQLVAGAEPGASGFPAPVQPEAEVNEGIISTEEARKLLLHWNLVPPEILGMTVEQEMIYDVRSYGPRVRAWNDGRVERLDAGAVFQGV